MIITKHYVNGKEFTDIKEAEEYEAKIAEQEKIKKEKEEQKEKRLAELKELEKQYVDKINDFCKDYGYYQINLKGIKNLNSNYDIFESLFNNFII